MIYHDISSDWFTLPMLFKLSRCHILSLSFLTAVVGLANHQVNIRTDDHLNSANPPIKSGDFAP